jgi:hypothetical protein
MDRVPDRRLGSGLAAAVHATWPSPVPLAPALIVIQFVLLAAVHVHVLALAVT